MLFPRSPLTARGTPPSAPLCAIRPAPSSPPHSEWSWTLITNTCILPHEFQFVRSIVREVAGFAPYERRVMELLRNSKDKKARKLTKRRVCNVLPFQDLGGRLIKPFHYLLAARNPPTCQAQSRRAYRGDRRKPKGRSLIGQFLFSLVSMIPMQRLSCLPVTTACHVPIAAVHNPEAPSHCNCAHFCDPGTIFQLPCTPSTTALYHRNTPRRIPSTCSSSCLTANPLDTPVAEMAFGASVCGEPPK